MTDDRLPGVPRFKAITWQCQACGMRIRDENQPECPDDGSPMEAAVPDHPS
jgi:ABC-type ATPase with predicted acetyltransferase domain